MDAKVNQSMMNAKVKQSSMDAKVQALAGHDVSFADACISVAERSMQVKTLAHVTHMLCLAHAQAHATCAGSRLMHRPRLIWLTPHLAHGDA